jgi:pimeloyl-ACP methyl ester carboxylesterase
MDNRKLGMEVTSVEMERPVRFQSRGKNIFGILHNAENNSKRVGVIFLNAGLQYRVGPHRIYVKTARRLSQLGFTALRIDFPGIGDSEGEIGDVNFDLFDTEDTLRAIDFLTKEEKIERVVLLGTCAGARNALMTAAKDKRVDSIVSWSLPIITDLQKISGSILPGSEAMSKVTANGRLRGWMKKTLSANTWRRFLSGKSDSNLFSIYKVLWILIAGSKKREDERHREFFEAFETFLSSKRKALFVYGERDIILKEEFEAKFKELSEGKIHSCEYYIVSEGHHTFTSIKAEKNVIDKTVKWLIQQYGFENYRIKNNQISRLITA